jgi:hypothetical protein
MGFKLEINNYSIFEALSKGHYHPLYSKAISAFTPFKLFAFILHNPYINQSFDKYLNANFPLLDLVSGEDLLFFAIISNFFPDTEKFTKSDHYRFRNINEESKVFLRKMGKYNIKDNDASSYLLSKMINIEYSELPILIISNNFKSNDILTLKTSEYELRNQLSELGNFSRMNDTPFFLDKIIDAKLSSCKNSGRIKLNIKLCEILAFFYSAVTDVRNNDPSADYFFDKRIASIKSDINSIKIFNIDGKERVTDTGLLSNETSVFSDEFYNNNLSYITGLSLRFNNPLPLDEYSTTSSLADLDLPVYTRRNSDKSANIISHDESKGLISNNIIDDELDRPMFMARGFHWTRSLEEVSVDNNYIEKESVIILSTLNSVIKMINNDRDNEDYVNKGFDYSPLIISLTKLFEIEINLSIVHWIRKYLRIHLPEYFNKHEPGLEAKFKLSMNQESVIDFNKGYNLKWLPPGLGQSELALKELKSKFKFFLILKKFKFNYEILIKNWELIRKTRNRAAHTELMNCSDFLDIHSAMKLLNSKRYFEKFSMIKKEFRGENI